MTSLCVTLVTLVAIGYSNAWAPEPTESYPEYLVLDEQDNYHMYWKVDLEELVITWEVHVRTRGWVGFGLSPNGGMKGADIVIGYIRNGETYFSDRFADANAMPEIDESQDFTLLESSEGDEYTLLKFSRKFQTCDSKDMEIKEFSTSRVIYSWGLLDPESEDNVEYHGPTRRGVKSVLFVNHIPAPEHEDEQLQYFDMRVNTVLLPTKRTYYHCRVMSLPVVSGKRHITKIVPMINEANLGVVHHIVTYFCHGENLKDEAFGRECWEGNMPENASNCDTIAYGWGVGQTDYHYPAAAGLAFGSDADPKFFHLEMHYDNPQGLEGVVDDSGLRFYYTEDLRAHDVGTLLVGHSLWWPPMSIPPKAKDFRVDAYCNAACTDGIPAGGIQVFSSFPHTHQIGTAIWSTLVRDGKEIAGLGRDDYYDFNYQQTRAFREAITIMPGDEILTSCVYNSEGQTNVTYGGPGTDNEMCLNFFFYYPAMPLQSCLSTTQAYYPVHQIVMKKAMRGDILVDPEDEDNFGIYKYLDQVSWTETDVEEYQLKTTDIHTFQQFCAYTKKGFGVFGGGESTHEMKIKVKEPMPVEDVCTTVESAAVRDVAMVTAVVLATITAIIIH